ncbi:MAG: hypothetical protein IPM58_12680 [Nitrospira sp.]|nr:hypothetical protein [Nitrospira sp.]
MKLEFIVIVVAGFVGSSMGMAFADDLVTDQEATPTIEERLTETTVKGTLMSIKGSYYSIKDNDGKEHFLHVDLSTKLDVVRPGDKVKAYVTDQGHTTTLQRAD